MDSIGFLGHKSPTNCRERERIELFQDINEGWITCQGWRFEKEDATLAWLLSFRAPVILVRARTEEVAGFVAGRRRWKGSRRWKGDWQDLVSYAAATWDVYTWASGHGSTADRTVIEPSIHI